MSYGQIHHYHQTVTVTRITAATRAAIKQEMQEQQQKWYD